MYKNTRTFRSNDQIWKQKLAKMSKRRQVDVSKYIKKASFQEEVAYESLHSFQDFEIEDILKQNISNKGYVHPTPIQDKAIPLILEGKDVIGIANTGTGKTAAFLIPLINKVYKNPSEKVLIIAPTRELAVQIDKEFSVFAKHTSFYSTVCIGGANMNRQIRSLKGSSHFVIGTPGRLMDLEKQGKIRFSEYSTIVLDEVDRMLDMGFIKDIRTIITKLSRTRHSLFFSATIPQTIKPLMEQFLTNPVTVSVSTASTSENVNQDIIRSEGRAKIDVLHDLLISEEFEKVLIFGRTKWGIEKLTRALEDRGFKVASIHGNKKQAQRQRALEQFRNNKIHILLATDIASRGIDIPDITHVINYDLPEKYEDYIHRIGRTGRASKVGTALTFVD